MLYSLRGRGAAGQAGSEFSFLFILPCAQPLRFQPWLLSLGIRNDQDTVPVCELTSL